MRLSTYSRRVVRGYRRSSRTIESSRVKVFGRLLDMSDRGRSANVITGLSLLFFILSLVGNATYGAGVGHPSYPSTPVADSPHRSSFTPSKGNTSSSTCLGSSARWAPWPKTPSSLSSFVCTLLERPGYLLPLNESTLPTASVTFQGFDSGLWERLLYLASLVLLEMSQSSIENSQP